MAGDWIKLRTGLESHMKTHVISQECGLTREEVVMYLYRLACWFREQGRYGKMECDPSVIDHFLSCEGFAAALLHVKWMTYENRQISLRHFCDVSSIRKSLGKVIRRQILHSGAKCRACFSVQDLQIDHNIPVSRGGNEEISNLQALCRTCNSAKGTKTMEEFLRDR